MNRRFRHAGLLAATIGASCSMCPHQPAPDESVQVMSIPLRDGIDQRIELRIPNGHVTVAHGERLSCEVEVRVRADDPLQATDWAANVVPIPDLDPNDGLRVIGVHAPGVPAEQLRVTCVLHAPPSVDVQVLTRQAPVVVRNFAGRLQVDSDAGAVTADLGDGATAHLTTSSGVVLVSGGFAAANVASTRGPVRVIMEHDARADPDAAVTLQVDTKSADVTIDLEHGCHVDFTAKTRNGKLVACELSSDWDAYSIDSGDRWRSYHGRIGAGGTVTDLATTSVTVHTENGQIALRCLPGSDAESVAAESPE